MITILRRQGTALTLEQVIAAAVSDNLNVHVIWEKPIYQFSGLSHLISLMKSNWYKLYSLFQTGWFRLIGNFVKE